MKVPVQTLSEDFQGSDPLENSHGQIAQWVELILLFGTSLFPWYSLWVDIYGKNMFMGLYILQVGGMFTAAQIVTQGTITWPKMLNSIIIKGAFQMLFGGFFPPKEYPPPALRNFFAYNIW